MSMLLAAGCGFKPRKAADIPPELHTLHIETPNPNSTLSTQLTALLYSLKINLTPSAKDAKVTLHIDNITFTHDQPDITTSGEAVTFIYTMHVNAELIRQSDHHVITQKTFQAQQPLLLNTNQVYAQGVSTLIRRTLQREIIALIYDWLIAEQTQQQLMADIKNPHATTTQTINTSS